MLKELMMRRESVRAYTDAPVPRDVLLDLVDTARLSPSARNKQHWRFLICDGEQARKVASTAMVFPGMRQWHRECPAFILITTEQTDPALPHDFAIADAAIAATVLTLAATEKGLGSCILGSCREDMLKELFPIGEGRRVELVVAVGYATEQPGMLRDRKPLGEVAAFAD